jgi:hypothetical protein
VNRKNIDERKCGNDRISLLTLNRLVEEALEREFSLSSMKQKDLTLVSRKQAETERKKLEKEIEDAGYQMEKLKTAGSEDYIRYRLGELPESEMMEKADKRKADIEKLQDRQKMLSRRLAEVDVQAEKRNHYLRTLLKCKKGTPLTAEVLHALIERIDVYPDKRVEIHFAFSGRDFEKMEGGGRA